ncbi:hypothetical protein M1O52_04305 [Dehalococcoidia bacterium]|nr:hypothetical protein [Dehalococcoidia bacterium]
MAKSQDNGTTILLGLKDYKVGEVWGGEKKVVVKVEVKGRIKCPHCGSGKLYRHGICQPREILHTWRVAEEFTLSSTAADGSAVIVSAPLLKAGTWYGLVPR